jgi:hypothetical protein
MLKHCIHLIIIGILSSCGLSNNNEKKGSKSSIPNTVEQESNSTVLNFNYRYPRNVLPPRQNEYSYEFYPIGFSPEGNFAYINRPCNGGCGCCTHEILIQDLLTDKIETKLSILNPSEFENTSHVESWNSNFSSIEKALKLKGISQKNFQIENMMSFYNKDKSHKYDIKINKNMLPPHDNQTYSNDLSYEVYATIDNQKTKRITYGKIQEAKDLEYIGFIRSPFTDIIAVILNQQSYGYEGEVSNKLIAIGCHLDPSFY